MFINDNNQRPLTTSIVNLDRDMAQSFINPQDNVYQSSTTVLSTLKDKFINAPETTACVWSDINSGRDQAIAIYQPLTLGLSTLEDKFINS